MKVNMERLRMKTETCKNKQIMVQTMPDIILALLNRLEAAENVIEVTRNFCNEITFQQPELPLKNIYHPCQDVKYALAAYDIVKSIPNFRVSK